MCGLTRRENVQNLLTMRSNVSFAFMNLDGRSIKAMYTHAFDHFFAMSATCRTINLMREMKVNQQIVLEELYHLYEDESKFYRGRPEMIVMRMRNGRNLQIFRGGKVQILGRIPDEEAENMRQEFVRRLKRLKKMENCQVTRLTIVNLVVSLQLPSNINLKSISHSNHELSYEMELFPAALIRKWHPAHVAVFHNGKVIVTGIKSMNVVDDILKSVMSFFSEKLLL